MKIKKILITLVVVLMITMIASAQTYVPKETKVAIVPVINQASEKWPDLQKRQIEACNDWLAKEFPRHGFVVIPPDEVAKAIAELNIDLKDEEQRSRANLYKIGQKVGATIVAFPVIVASDQNKTGGLFPKSQGSVTIKFSLVDSLKQEPIINGVTLQGKASGSSFLTGIEKGSDLQVKAVGNTLKDQLKKFFAIYPAIGG